MQDADSISQPNKDGIVTYTYYHPGTKQPAKNVAIDPDGNTVTCFTYDANGWPLTYDTYWPASNKGAVQHLKEKNFYKSCLVVKCQTFDEKGNPDNRLLGGCCSWEIDDTTRKKFKSIKIADLQHNSIEMVQWINDGIDEHNFTGNTPLWQKLVAHTLLHPPKNEPV